MPDVLRIPCEGSNCATHRVGETWFRDVLSCEHSQTVEVVTPNFPAEYRIERTIGTVSLCFKCERVPAFDSTSVASHPIVEIVDVEQILVGMCAMCGITVPVDTDGRALKHERTDVMAMLERGDFDA